MALKQVIINNYKSIKKCNVLMENLNLFIGENGTGKTNVLEAIKYFYDNLEKHASSNSVFDWNNLYSNEVSIKLIFDVSHFIKIANKQVANLSDRYYEEILSLPHNEKLETVVELKQIKGREISWNLSYKERSLIKSLFPLFYIDVRKLDVEQWSEVWEISADLMKVSHEAREQIKSDIITGLKNMNGNISKSISGIEEVFKRAKIDVTYNKSKDFARNLVRLIYAGNNIQKDGKVLPYYSAGTNSVKYIEILLDLIDEIAKTKLKEPFVILDEPELGLHTKLIDELSETLVYFCEKTRVCISTHSPRLTKNMLINIENANVFHVSLKQKYTVIDKMKNFLDYQKKGKFLVTDNFINTYFSKAILFVEGETELEMFSNPYLRELFPKIKEVDVIKAMTQKDELSIMSPKQNKDKIPYIYLIDMDKIFSYNLKSKKIKLKNEFFPDADIRKIKLRYEKRNSGKEPIFFQYRRLKKMEENLAIHIRLPFGSSNDFQYYSFIQVIKDYFSNFNIFVCRTTIEGMLINSITLERALEYYKHDVSPSLCEEFLNYWNTLVLGDRVNFLRILFGGKTDMLQSMGNVLEFSLDSTKQFFKKLTIKKKVSGWINIFLEEYFKEISHSTEEFNIKKFKNILEQEGREKFANRFSRDFEELYLLIEEVCDMV